MSKSNRIVEGDIVDVYFLMSPYISKATVVYVPQATGDMWVFKTTENDTVYVNSSGADLTRIVRHDTEVNNPFSQIGGVIADALAQEEK